ncbi:gamma-glutamyl phosphate reductase [Verticillium alfalfae VaMs.102]|uniref:glutamate-5-semialdehyde dehydrogenase n=1 Tax=Verticillium alfalfae (strain VaMs.102 / ATCC MYA-4576 / FGSC 10136) TaxID=526221 RepID=C9S593_VERA1|nr:gamma-glutamyl phosphate reductase [Verticillium alfalfae VaMs.102]EEY14193.1 gamma-glutamyl phosphate reductase [Verticillium alfalfae VaMs.102]
MSLTNASPADCAQSAKLASHVLATLPTSARNDALTAIHDALAASKEDILKANAEDVELARKAAADGTLSQSLVSRLDLGRKGKFEDMLKGILDVRDLEDPIGRLTLRTRLDDGLTLDRVTCPIGVLLIIFEARPEVIANIASLAIKSGNAAILKGGKESTRSFVAVATVIAKALDGTRVPNQAVQLVTTRDVIPELLALDHLIDLVIPRGSNELVRTIKNTTRIPVLGHADGPLRHLSRRRRRPHARRQRPRRLQDELPRRLQRLETLLVQESALQQPDGPFAAAARALLAAGVTLHLDAASQAAVRALAAADDADAVPAAQLVDVQPDDYRTEFLSLDLAVKTVPDQDAAVAHIHAHSSKHTDLILTADADAAERFMAAVDSAGCYWNASTRMADGMRYGFGTEVGISTNKIHARGPVGLEGLMIYKYKLRGPGPGLPGLRRGRRQEAVQA